MTYITDQDQDQRAAQYQIAEDLYNSGLTDASDLVVRQSSDYPYSLGYEDGLKQAEDYKVAEKETEYPLVCGQCSYLKFGSCQLTQATRSHKAYACPQVLIEAPF